MSALTNYLLQFGSYVFDRTFYPAEDDLPQIVPVQKSPRSDVNRGIRGSLGPRRLKIHGGWVGNPSAIIGGVDIPTKLDLLLEALISNAPSNLYFGNSQRYLRLVQCEDVPKVWGSRFGRSVEIEIPLVAADPFYYSLLTYTDVWHPPSSGSTRVFVGGAQTAYQQPIYSMTVAGTGAKTIDWTFSNTSIGKSLTLAGSVTGGDIIIVDTLNQTVTIGGVDKIALFDGQWVELRAGSDTFTIAYGAAACSKISLLWQRRYLA